MNEISNLIDNATFSWVLRRNSKVLLNVSSNFKNKLLNQFPTFKSSSNGACVGKELADFQLKQVFMCN